jgi:c-di-GMP-binding flagellar brake protein YcgR
VGKGWDEGILKILFDGFAAPRHFPVPMERLARMVVALLVEKGVELCMDNQSPYIRKRGAYRLDYQAPTRYRFAKKTAPGKYQTSSYLKGMGANFSLSGAAIDIGKPLPAKTLVYLEIKFPYSDAPFLATAEVVNREDAVVMGKQAYRVGIRFLLVDEAAQDRMASFLISGGKI